MPDFVRGSSGSDDLSANNGGSQVRGGAGDDVLRGGKGDDIIWGGAGDDQLWGGAGADQFRFYGNAIDGASDTDRIYDLNFAQGDRLVFGNYAGLFQDAEGVNAFDGGDSAIIRSWEGLVNAVEASNGRITYGGSTSTNLLFITLDNGDGQSQVLRITGGYSGFLAAMGTAEA